MKRALSARLLRWLAWAAIVSAIVYVLQPIPSIGPTTVSMLLLLAVLAIAAGWGTSGGFSPCFLRLPEGAVREAP